MPGGRDDLVLAAHHTAHLCGETVRHGARVIAASFLPAHPTNEHAQPPRRQLAMRIHSSCRQ